MGQDQLSGNDYYYFAKETIRLTKIATDDLILDIGGGGEGIIGKLNGRSVVSVDPSAEELREADNDALKVVMDAVDLKFLDDSFSAMTSFFTMMYISVEKRPAVFLEISRVLKKGGSFYLWDLKIEDRNDIKQDVLVIPLEVAVNGETIETGYGCRWRDKIQDDKLFIELAQDAGLKVKENRSHGQLIEMQFYK